MTICDVCIALARKSSTPTMHPRETGPDCPVLTSLADPRFSAQGHDHLYHDLRNGAGTSVGQGQ